MEFINEILVKILTGIDWAVFEVFKIHNIGICIILFTIIVYAIMIPLNAKQQKSSRLMNRINPELKAIQAKYKDKKDNESVMKMNAEQQELYAKYGVSPFGGCLPMLITLPIMFALYRVIMNITELLPVLKDGVMFLGLDVTKTPSDIAKAGNVFAYLIPVLAVVFQFINTKMLQTKEDKTSKTRKTEEDSMAASMKMMNYFMPFMSGIFCLTLSVGIGLYWITGSIFRIVQAYFINRHVDNISLDDLIEKNKDKAEKKAKKREEMNRQMEVYSKQKTSSIKTATDYKNAGGSNVSSKAEKLNVNKDFEPGSIAGYANMLSGSNKDKK